MIKIDFEKLKEFLLHNINKFLMILILVSFINGVWLLHKEINSIKQEMRANQSLINSLRDWNHHIDEKIKENRRFIEEKCAY